MRIEGDNKEYHIGFRTHSGTASESVENSTAQCIGTPDVLEQEEGSNSLSKSRVDVSELLEKMGHEDSLSALYKAQTPQEKAQMLADEIGISVDYVVKSLDRSEDPYGAPVIVYRGKAEPSQTG